MFKIILTGTLGTVIEWAEYAFYGYITLIIATHFFPASDAVVNVIAAFALFAAGFLMRPIGAVLFGHIADCVGRKRALFWSMLLMALATLAIGCLPTYQQVGIMAPIALLCCRLLQGLAVSSECLGAAVFLVEHAGKTRPYLAGSWPGFAAALGMTLGGIAATLVTHPLAPVWAWRLPFFMGAIGCVVAVYLRQQIDETPAFLQAKAKRELHSLPIRKIWRGYGVAMLRVASCAIFAGGLVYVGNVYFTTYLVSFGQFSMHQATLITTLGEFMVVLCYPLAGLMADRTGGLRVMQYGLVFIILLAPITFYLAKSGIWMYALFAQAIYAIADASVTAPMFKWMTDQFPTEIRVTGIGVSWNIAIALLGGTAPLAAEYSTQQLHLSLGPGYIISCFAILVWMAIRYPERERSTQNETLADLSLHET